MHLQLAAIHMEPLVDQDGDDEVINGCLLLMDKPDDVEIDTSDILYIQEYSPN